MLDYYVVVGEVVLFCDGVVPVEFLLRLGSTMFCVSMFSKIVLVSFTGMFGYKFFMSSDAKLKYGSHGVSLKFWISSFVFFTLKAFGNGAMWFILFVNSLDSF